LLFFKTGFSPTKTTLASYSELLDFKESLNDTVLYKEYTDLTDFEKELFPNLFLAENYPPVKEPETSDVTTAALSQSNLVLIRMLQEKEREIKELKEKTLLPGKEGQDQLQQLLQEKEAIQKELLQSEEIRKQQAKEKEALEQQLSLQKEKDNLKAKALEEVKKGNYAEAETYLKESAKEKISDVASTFFELAKIKKLQLQYAKAFDYYELAVKINPADSLYLNEAGIMADDLGYYDKAIGYYQNSLTIVLQETSEEHPDIAIRYNNLGSAYKSKGEYDKAISYYNRSLPILQKFLPANHPYIAICQQNLVKAKAAIEKQQTPKPLFPTGTRPLIPFRLNCQSSFLPRPHSVRLTLFCPGSWH
jgi:tetratricopeptide (TPR) repeat protein